MDGIQSAQERSYEDTRRTDDATKPLGPLPESPRYEAVPDRVEFRLFRSGIPSEILLFDRGTDRLVPPRRRAVRRAV